MTLCTYHMFICFLTPTIIARFCQDTYSPSTLFLSRLQRPFNSMSTVQKLGLLQNFSRLHGTKLHVDLWKVSRYFESFLLLHPCNAQSQKQRILLSILTFILECKDLNSNCPGWLQYCSRSSIYWPYMSRNCKKTCKICTGDLLSLLNIT